MEDYLVMSVGHSRAKTIELRRWNTKYRGHILIHAPLKVRLDDCRRLDHSTSCVTGAIIGRVRLDDIKRYGTAEEVAADYMYHLAGVGFADNRYGFILVDPVRLVAPVPYSGRLGLYDTNIPHFDRNQIISDIIDEDYRYQWVNRH